jgi:hypothetical protein
MNDDNKVSSGTSDMNANRDPISGTPGSHVVGTGIGAAVGGAAAGAAAGTVVGPVGTAIGAVAGAVVGGLAGKGVAEAIDPTSEAAYWRDNFKDRPYAGDANSFEDYEPAYGFGVSSYTKYPGRSFDEVEDDLARDWDEARGTSNLQWDQARNATRDAWERIDKR